MSDNAVRVYGVKELVSLCWESKVTIIASVVVASLISVFIAINSSNLYKSEVILEYVKDSDSNLSSAASKIGQLANFAGLSLGGGGNSRQSIDLATLASRKFLSRFIAKHEILVPLFATEEWDLVSGKLSINPEIYNEQEGKWLREVKLPLKAKPSEQEAVIAFSDIFAVFVNKETGLIHISVTFLSAELANQWLTLLVKDYNEYIREQDLQTSQKNIEYLEKSADSVGNANMKLVFFSLLEEEQKKTMLAQVSEEYVFKVIDPSIVAEKRDSPKRALISIIGAVIGGFIGIFIVLIRQFFRD
jgi:LPS O-antigen subunit length determinant protein (WzzB/FepE family)